MQGVTARCHPLSACKVTNNSAIATKYSPKICTIQKK